MKYLAGLAVAAAALILTASSSSAGVDCPIDFDAEECDDISVTKEAGTVVAGDGSEVLQGGTIVYTVEVCNEGEFAATGVVFTDQLPLGTRFQSSSGADFHLAFDETSSQVTGTVEGDLLGCATAFISVTAAEDAPCGLNLDNAVVVNSDQPEAVPGDNTASVRTVVVCEDEAPTPTPTPDDDDGQVPAAPSPSVGTGDGSAASTSAIPLWQLGLLSVLVTLSLGIVARRALILK